MPSQQNIATVRALSDNLSRAKVVILTDYSGLPMNLQQELRQRIANAGGQFLVAKNTLFKLALSEMGKRGLPSKVEETLRGPTAFLFAYDDEIAPLKALVEFSKEHELPKSKLGIMLKPTDRILSIEEIEQLAKLQSRDQLLAQLVGTLNAPTFRLVNALSGNLRKLTSVLDQIKHKKQATQSN